MIDTSGPDEMSSIAVRLRSEAADRGVKGRSTMNQQQLEGALDT